jgi:hypothetical protein
MILRTNFIVRFRPLKDHDFKLESIFMLTSSVKLLHHFFIQLIHLNIFLDVVLRFVVAHNSRCLVKWD